MTRTSPSPDDSMPDAAGKDTIASSTLVWTPRATAQRPLERVTDISLRLLDWFTRCQRPLPWRQTYAPYAVWIAEVMLQQTQMDRAVAYYARWMDRFPDLRALAAADEDDVLKLWEGLGYYTRARNLRLAARYILDRYDGELPAEEAALRALPGVGAYTAAAILSQAFGQDLPAIDANAERVLARLFDVDAPVKEKAGRLRIHELATTLLPSGRARDFNQALMEFGALVCTRRPRCAECVLADTCESLRLGIVGERPVRLKSPAIVHLNVATGVLVREGRLFIQKRPQRGAWAGLWEFPGGRIEPDEAPARTVEREFLEETELRVRSVESLGQVRHGYTTYRVTLHCFRCILDQDTPTPILHAATTCRWVQPSDLGRYAFPAGHRLLVDRLLQSRHFAVTS